MEFAREKEDVFYQWLRAKNVDDSFEKLRQLILIEGFQQRLSHDLATHLSDKKLDRVNEAAVTADSYTLKHTKNFHEMKNTWSSENYFMKGMPEQRALLRL